MSQQINQNYVQSLGDWAQNFDTLPGIDRDNPPAKKNSHMDGQWTRFYNGSARKMGGYEKLLQGNSNPVRALYTVAIQDFTRVFIFRDTGVSQADILSNGSVTGEINRTPLDWVAPAPGTPSLTYSIDSMTLVAQDGSGTVQSTTFLFFVAPPNSENINQTTEAPIFFGPINDTTPFSNLGQSTSGGIIVSLPFLLKYGNDGVVYWSKAGNPTIWPTNNYIGADSNKILSIKEYQGGLLAWTSDSLKRGVYNTQDNTFVFTTAVPTISLLSPSSIVAGHNSTFYWVGKDEFYIFNGAVQTIKNTDNKVQFYNKINPKYEGKVFGLYVGNFSEIWWFSPQDDNTECSHLYNFKYQEGIWSDSECSRTAGVGNSIYKYPLLADGKPNIYSGLNSYSIWAHEKGNDIVDNGIHYPLLAYIQTKQFSVIAGNPQVNVEMRLSKIEKDMLQSGDMICQVITFPFSNSDPEIAKEITFGENINQLDIQVSGRFIAFKFISNTLDGFFQIGNNLVNYKLGAQRPGGTQ